MNSKTLIHLWLVLATLAGCATVRRELGHALISDQTEIELGTKLAAQIEAEEHVHPDSRLQAYIQRVTRPLIAEAQPDRPGIRYQIKVIDDPAQINAFAVPGGFLYVYSGLLLVASDEAEVAGVLGHEIGHIVGRHSANQLAAQFGFELLAGLALGEDPYKLGQIASQLSRARFSRHDEREADVFGVKYTVVAGYDPRGLMDFFNKFKELEARRPSDLEKLFSSHPPTGERIRRIEQLITEHGATGGERHHERFLRATAALRQAHGAKK